MATSKSSTEAPRAEATRRAYRKPRVVSQRLVGTVYGVSCPAAGACDVPCNSCSQICVDCSLGCGLTC